MSNAAIREYEVEVVRLYQQYQSTTVKVSAASRAEAKALVKKMDLCKRDWDEGESEYRQYEYDVL